MKNINDNLTEITSISATTYYNLPPSSFTGGTVTGDTTFNATTTLKDMLILPSSTIQTTNATATLIKTISVSNNSVNMLEIDVYGGTTTGTAGIVYKIWTTYRKTSGGSLVLIGVDNIVSNSDYPYPIGGEVLVNSSGGNITVSVKGQLATVIDWGCSVKINTMVLGVL